MRDIICPRCNSGNIVKNGNTVYGKPKFMCKDCRKHFLENPDIREITDEKKELVKRMLSEKISPAGICRVLGISQRWLQSYVDEIYQHIEKKIETIGKGKTRLIIECDEIWSYVGNKKNKYRIWFAIDVVTKEIVGFYVGSRGREGAEELWNSLPPEYRQCAVIYTDFWEAYAGVLPSERHRPVAKNSGKTSHIERFNNTVRQRISRFVRKTLSFSKKLENHIGAILLFIHHYNAMIIKEITNTI